MAASTHLLVMRLDQLDHTTPRNRRAHLRVEAFSASDLPHGTPDRRCESADRSSRTLTYTAIRDLCSPRLKPHHRRNSHHAPDERNQIER